MFRLAETIRRTKTDQGGILLDVRQGRMYCLNPLGSTIVELLERGLDETTIAAQISNTYAVPIATVHSDICSFIDDLKKHQLLQFPHSAESISRRLDP